MKNDFLKKTAFALASLTVIGLCASCGRIDKTATGESDSQARPTETGGFSWTSSESENAGEYKGNAETRHRVNSSGML